MEFTRTEQAAIKSLVIHLPLFTQQVFIGEDLSSLIVSRLTEQNSKNVVIASQSVYPRISGLVSRLSDQEPIIIKSHEGNKTFDFARDLATQCHEKQLNRDSFLIGIGGGMLGDLVGFLASVYMRGVKFVFIPTTLLSQCDSTINKVAVSVDSAKNLMGSFYSPHFTFCDTAFLQSLSIEQVSYGLVEVIKHTLITRSTKIDQLLRTNLADGLNGWRDYPWEEIIYESLKVKASIVEADPFDRHGLQKGLNYGHTTGHAIEGMSNYAYPHGLAVAIGMKLAGYISKELNMLTEEELGIQHELLSLAKLDLTLPQNFDIPTLISWMKKDKVNDGTGLRLVLLEKLGKYQTRGGINECLVADMLFKHLVKK